VSKGSSSKAKNPGFKTAQTCNWAKNAMNTKYKSLETNRKLQANMDLFYYNKTSKFYRI
jgi:hypothetical protein